MKFNIYAGTYSVRSSKGIYVIQADSGEGTLKMVNAYQAKNPSYLTACNGLLFAALECDDFDGYGGAASFAIAADGLLSLLSAVSTGGKSPCHVCAGSDGKKLYVSNYSDGTVSVFDAENGILSNVKIIAHNGHGSDEMRQKGPHVHCVQPEPGSGRICVVDLGIDSAVFYNAADMSAAGCFRTDSGCGPRHIVFSDHNLGLPENTSAWMVCELSNEVYAFASKSGKRTGIYPTLPKDYKGKSSCAAIKLSPDNKRLYVSNRGHNSIACYAIDAQTGGLSLLDICPCGGKTPRDIALSPDGCFLYTANQDSDNIAVHKLKNGVPAGMIQSLSVPSPVCLLIGRITAFS